MLKLACVFALAALCLAALPTAMADNWAVIVAGSDTYSNYRHQADAAHNYQILRKNGIKPENIITFMVDDIANNRRNPFPGQIFNKPTPAGNQGVDVYSGVKIDYSGKDVTPENFVAVLTGNSTGVPAGHKVLQSGPNDKVFVTFFDHGAPGLIAFPSEYLYAQDLIAALKTMHQKQMYGQLVFYMEACESGSMFAGLLPDNLNIYVTTAANPDESSWGTYCPPQDQVNGKSVGSCLGDLYAVSWMENTEQVGTKQTLQQQYLIVKNLTAQSHVMQYGDMSFVDSPISEFMGGASSAGKKRLGMTHRLHDPTPATAGAAPSTESVHKVSSRDIPLNDAYYRYLRAERFSAESRDALAALRAELDAREEAEDRFQQLSHLLSQEPSTGKYLHTPEHLFRAPTLPIRNVDCMKAAVQALQAHGCDYNDHSLQFHRVIVNACGRHSTVEHGIQAVVGAIKKVCA